VLGLAEMMNFPGAIGGDPEVLAKLEAAAGRPKDGHAPLVSGKELQAYLVAGPDSDHEATQLAEAQEKVRAGMYLFLREGSASHNLAALLPAVTPHNARRFCFACDDLQPADLLHAGHLDRILRKAVRLDLDPILAVQMATLNVAERFGLRRYGAIAPGYWADFALVENLNDFLVRQVYKRGQLVAENGEPRFEAPPPNNAHLRRTFHVAGLTLESFRLPWKGGNCRAIEVLPRQILTREVIVQPRTEGGYVVSDPTRDLLKAAVIERHRGTGLVGVGLVRGFGLKRGALASSVGHDSHNLTVVGVTDEDLWAAAQAVIEMNGGWAVVTWGEVVACLPLPIAGLMSDQPVGVVARQVGQLQEAAWTLGCTLPEPFMTLSFLSLAVIPELRLTPRGLVDVQKFALVEVGC
ncbi:MAG TPA: adenine deaminase, partial [Armatimonadetes bacterium]|nr:adenine deaminase [Armatimonadota bacterium]